MRGPREARFAGRCPDGRFRLWVAAATGLPAEIEIAHQLQVAQRLWRHGLSPVVADAVSRWPPW
jgi:hypothetical protein